MITNVLSELLQAIDRDDTAVLIPVNLSAALDMRNHEIVLERLRVSLGFDGGPCHSMFVGVVSALLPVHLLLRYIARIGPRTNSAHHLHG